MEKYLKKYYRFFFLAVAVLLLYPSFQKGYIFALDWTIKPFITFLDIKLTDPLGWMACDFFSVIFTFEIFQRIFLFALIFLAGMAGFRLARRTNNLYAQYFCGLFFIFNPFFYARLIEQTMIVAGGAVAFLWFLVFFLEYIEERKSKKLIISSLLGALAVSFFAHSIFFVGLALVIMLIFDFLKNRDGKFILKTLLISLGVIFILNSNWFFSSLLGTNTWASNVKNFTQADLDAFDTSGVNGNSVYTTVLALQGYWGEYQDRFVSIQKNPLWSVAFLLIFALAIFGAVKLWKKDPFVTPLIVLFGVAFVLAIGIASPLFKPIALFLYQHIPFYISLREPQKWVVILVFVYAYLGGWGIKYLLEVKKIKDYRTEIGVLCVILPIIFSFSAIQGMHEHFTPHKFPIEWQEAKDFINKNPTDGKFLFLPWHSYMNFDFAGKNIVTPAEPYFGKNVISGNNIEFGKVYSDFKDEQSLTIQKYVVKEANYANNQNLDQFSKDMQKLGVQKIMLAKAEDWRDYAWLDKIGDIRKVFENNKLIIYQINERD